MSNYQSKALNPRNHLLQPVQMLDNFYGRHKFAVAFQDGSKYPENQVVCIHPDDLDAEDVRVYYQNESRVIWAFGGGHLIDGVIHRRLSHACVAFKNTVDEYRRDT